MNLGSIILKAINHEYWIKIEYKNSNDEITKFMIGINDIDSKDNFLICDCFNLKYGEETKKDYTIVFKNILNAELKKDTYHKTPDTLIDKITKNYEMISFLKSGISKNDLLDYYVDCFKMDTTPYISKYGLISGIDNDTLIDNDKYDLNDEQFSKLVNRTFYEHNDKDNKYYKELVLNELSIKTDKGLYVLAYRPLKLDIENKNLHASKDVIINKEFQYDSNDDKVINKESINKYMPEESTNLLNDFYLNKEEIVNIIRQYNDTRNSSYYNEVKIDTRPFIVCLEKHFSVDMDFELGKIKSYMTNYDVLPMPLSIFFGDTNVNLSRKVNYPIFTINDKYNIDQINAINVAFKSPCSYIQGPPGTGKTQTLLNAIVTGLFNNKTILVTSNNNIPMDGINNEIEQLTYKNRYKLLFPSIRLGSFENIKLSLFKMKEMYEKSLEFIPDNKRILNLKTKRKNDMKDLVSFLDKYDKYTELKERYDNLLKIKKYNNNPFINLNIDVELTDIYNKINNIGTVNIEDLDSKEYMKIDYDELFMAIHFETVDRLHKLSSNKYSDLFNIFNNVNELNAEEKVKDFKNYLSNPENFKAFQEIFPIIISTNLSCTYLGDVGNTFDIVMIDEAGQCNVANALIPISRGKQLMLVGDPQQLNPVILLDENINRKLRNKYHVPKEYDYISNSIYSTFTKVDTVNNETLLSYHYRCHEKIIAFNNKKYYNNKLKIKTKCEETKPLLFINTKTNDKTRADIKNTSIIEAKEIINLVKEYKDKQIGIITPFVHQKDCIEAYLRNNNITNIDVGTVHAYQGDQKDIIIFSSAITKFTTRKTYEWIKNNRELINVAMSRAKSKFILLGNENAVDNLSQGSDDISELFNYVKSNGDSNVTNVSLESFALGTRHISTESEKEMSETITHALSVLNTNCYIKNEVAVASLFVEDGDCSSLFYKQRFDIVIFEKGYGGDKLLLAIEENGPEHYSNEEVIRRDNEKKKFCERHNLKLLSIPRDCARDYDLIKKELIKIVK